MSCQGLTKSNKPCKIKVSSNSKNHNGKILCHIHLKNYINKNKEVIYENEVKNTPELEKQREIICIAAIGHDMCDKKYMNEKEGIENYKKYLSELVSTDNLEIIGKIIGTMSYSKVKANGYPELGQHQLAYHIVREADLLAAYDIDRCVMYSMYCYNIEYSKALQIAVELFDNRVFRMRQDKLFKTNYSKKESLKLHKKATIDVESLKNTINL